MDKTRITIAKIEALERAHLTTAGLLRRRTYRQETEVALVDELRALTGAIEELKAEAIQSPDCPDCATPKQVVPIVRAVPRVPASLRDVIATPAAQESPAAYRARYDADQAAKKAGVQVTVAPLPEQPAPIQQPIGLGETLKALQAP